MFLFATKVSGNSYINIEDLRNGKRTAYEQLFTEWYEPLCGYACSILRDMDEAEEVVQKIFCTLWDKRTEIRINISVKSYLYRAVHNGCMNRIKQTKIRSEHKEYYYYTKSGVAESTENSTEYSELEKALTTAIEALPPKCREVFELSRMQQLSYAEIAENLKISNNTVENHMAKALRLLREQLKDFLPFIAWLIAMKKW